jgi:hypothetical protein
MLLTGHRIFVGLLALALSVGSLGARSSVSADMLEGKTLLLPEERRGFEPLPPAPAGPRLLDPLPLTRLGLGPQLGLGFDVGQFGLLDPGTAVSVDLRLTWPGALGPTGEPGTVQPYVAVGPALLVAEPRDMMSPLGPQTDSAVAIGVRAGAGLSWQLDRETALFGEYRLTRGRQDLLGPLGGRGSGELGGFDLLYGVRLRF